MKPSVPETGMVVRLEGNIAHIVLQASDSCKGCGAAKLGLCKPGGNQSTLAARNTAGAAVGDTVKVELDSGIQTRGYMLAFIIPLMSLIAGAIAGNLLAEYVSMPALEVITGFAVFAAASFYSFRRLKRLNASSTMVVKEIISGRGSSV